MNRYLLRTLCTDIFNHVLRYLAEDNGVTLPSGSEFSLKVMHTIVLTVQMYRIHTQHFWIVVSIVAIQQCFIHFQERTHIIDALPTSMKKKVTAVNVLLSGKVRTQKYALPREQLMN